MLLFDKIMGGANANDVATDAAVAPSRATSSRLLDETLKVFIELCNFFHTSAGCFSST